MKNKIFHLQTTFKTAHDENEDLFIEGMASTNDIDRIGDVIEASAWKKGIRNFKNNPVILFNHNYDRPIGKATLLKVLDNGLSIKAKISKTAGDVNNLIKEGVLGAFSVGFQIKDAEWDKENDGLLIKEVELLEVSVVSVPANQSATFSVAKSFDNQEEYFEYLKSLNSVSLAGQHMAEDPEGNAASVTPEGPIDGAKSQEINMDPKDLQELIAEAVSAASKDTAKAIALENAKAKAAEEAKTKADAEEAARKEAEQEVIKVTVTTAAEKLMEGVEERFNKQNEDLATIVASLKVELADKSEEIQKIRENKGIFADRSGNGDWKKVFEDDVVAAGILARITKKGYTTDFAKDVMEKVNVHSGVEVSSEDFEQLVSTSIERDVELELVLPKLFREIQMNSATMILPILPDADYAQFANGTNGDTSDSGSAPKGNLDSRDAASPGVNTGIDLTEKILSVKRIVSKSYLGNETEEDAILPIMPLIRESMVRAHARAMEQAILNGGIPGGSPNQRGTDILAPGWTGLIATAVADAKEVDSGATAAQTAAMLLDMRQQMGKYGKNPADVVYIVSLAAYYNLLDDAEFQDLNIVGAQATKLRGEIGQVFGSPIIVSDEFTAAAAQVSWGLALNRRNFIMPRLRGFTMEQDYLVEDQRRVLVATQRVGFDRIHATTGQVVESHFTS